ncbi:hypothetical protein AC625_02695 [Peribacillus loiseleuriae]|uniref:Uncharacterized protein n=1 Tax=Peribacillus loiseleuriae TaxID=1679170 RepID=A0A0K9GPE1_9BACI|nr:hypothetical protein AC625_02695 [Peribacillus loiseleuriae]
MLWLMNQEAPFFKQPERVLRRGHSRKGDKISGMVLIVKGALFFTNNDPPFFSIPHKRRTLSCFFRKIFMFSLKIYYKFAIFKKQ